MNALHTLLTGSALSLALALGPMTPVMAQTSTPEAPATETAPAQTPPAQSTPAPVEAAPAAEAEPAPDADADADAAIDFGDDTSQWANDGECDDPRFTGAGAAEELLEDDLGHDATDCSAAFAEGNVRLLGPDEAAEAAATPETAMALDIDFGDDSSEWANDGECDDPRFTGPGAASELLDADRMRDATDCSAAFADGTVTLVEADTAAASAALAINRIDFGDDSGNWAHDGECDDPDFAGPGLAAKPTADGRLSDASDCRAAFAQGQVWLGSRSDAAVVSLDYGSDTSRWANDGECDDPRFTGPGTDKKLLDDDQMADASDCRALEAEGRVTIRPIFSPDYAAGAPYDSSGIDFGDDSSDYAHDDECDDPRFEGPGVASYQIESDIRHDASDCRAAFEAGTVMLREGEV